MSNTTSGQIALSHLVIILAVQQAGAVEPAAAKPIHGDSEFVSGVSVHLSLVLIDPATATRQSVAALLQAKYEMLDASHAKTKAIYIKVYSSLSANKAGSHDWVGCLKRGSFAQEDGITPQMWVDLGKTPGMRLGFSLPQRKRMYWERIQAEERAYDDAEAMVGDSDNSSKDAEREHRVWQVLRAIYEKEVAKKWGVTRPDLYAITEEGERKNWPKPDRPR